MWVTEYSWVVDKKTALAGGVLRSSCSVDCCCLTYSLINKLCLCFLVTIPTQSIILETNIVTCVFVKILDILTILPYWANIIGIQKLTIVIATTIIILLLLLLSPEEVCRSRHILPHPDGIQYRSSGAWEKQQHHQKTTTIIIISMVTFENPWCNTLMKALTGCGIMMLKWPLIGLRPPKWRLSSVNATGKWSPCHLDQVQWTPYHCNANF